MCDEYCYQYGCNYHNCPARAMTTDKFLKLGIVVVIIVSFVVVALDLFVFRA